ncbi:hypothetical protein J7438_26360, partial [Thalassotalea sp. G20_0]|nr:hypothetical protein [Thalassotalea sp. G20_0]
MITSGREAKAGISVGSFVGTASIAKTWVINSIVKSKNATAAISVEGDNPVICNVIVNGERNVAAERCQYDFCAVIDPDLAKLKRQIVNYPDTSITETMATIPGCTMNFPILGSATTTTPPTIGSKAPKTTFSGPDSATFAAPTPPPTIGSKAPKTTFSGPDSATFAAPTPPVASPSPAVIACIATLGTIIFVLVGVIAYRYYSQRSSTNAGRNRAEPMPPPPSGRPRAEGQLPT